MTEHHERHEAEPEHRRELTEREERFYGTDPDRDTAAEEIRDPEGDPHSGAAASGSTAAMDREVDREADREVERERPDEDREYREPARDATQEESVAGEPRETAPLFPPEEAESLRTRWDGIQTEFVDQPRAAVEKADALVGDVMQRLTDGFASERSRLEREWDRGDGVSTEDLRVALRRYRSFFDRLLSI